MTRNEFEAALRIFLRELSPLVLTLSPPAAAGSQLQHELDEARRLLQDGEPTDSALLQAAAGLVEEFVEAHWDQVVDSSFSSLATDLRKQ